MARQTVAEQLVEAIAKFRAHMERARADTRDNRTAPEVLDVQDACTFAQRTGLDTSLCRLLREFSAYPGSLSRADRERWEYLGFDLLAADRTRSQDRACGFMEVLRIRFSFLHEIYVYEFNKHWPLYIDGGPEYYQSGQIRVCEGEQLVCAYNVAQNPTDGHVDDYAYTPVWPTTLKLGDWIPAVIELDELARSPDQKRDLEYRDKVLYMNHPMRVS